MFRFPWSFHWKFDKMFRFPWGLHWKTIPSDRCMKNCEGSLKNDACTPAFGFGLWAKVRNTQITVLNAVGNIPLTPMARYFITSHNKLIFIATYLHNHILWRTSSSFWFQIHHPLYYPFAGVQASFFKEDNWMIALLEQTNQTQIISRYWMCSHSG